MLSDWSSSAATTKFTDPKWYTGEQHDAVGDVYIYSRRIRWFFGVHHYIAVSGIDARWRVYEWTDFGWDFYACDRIHGNKCLSLGRHKLSDVYRAAKAATEGSRYSTFYNCNHWTERAAAHLGYVISVYWNCDCTF